MTLLGAVLAGGRSSRFGSDKALALLDGKSLLDHAIAQLMPLTEPVVVVGRTHATLTSLADRPAAGLGPLGGLNAALTYAEHLGLAGVITVPCDAPSLTVADLRTLLGGNAAVFAGLPVCGYWPSELAQNLRDHLARAQSRSMQGWVKASGARLVETAGIIVNINEPADLAATMRTC